MKVYVKNVRFKAGIGGSRSCESCSGHLKEEHEDRGAPQAKDEVGVTAAFLGLTDEEESEGGTEEERQSEPQEN